MYRLGASHPKAQKPWLASSWPIPMLPSTLTPASSWASTLATWARPDGLQWCPSPPSQLEPSSRCRHGSSPAKLPRSAHGHHQIPHTCSMAIRCGQSPATEGELFLVLPTASCKGASVSEQCDADNSPSLNGPT